MTRYHCSMCNRCYHPSYQVFCMHPDNYSEPMDTYEYETDAGYVCPLNIAQDDYVSLFEEEINNRALEAEMDEKMKEIGIIRAHDLIDEDNNELPLPV